jgi:hypothetical protein
VCHQSVGLIARVVEAAGIPFLNYPLGHQTGKPDDREGQRAIVRDGLSAFETITRPGTIVELPYVWDPNDRGWEESNYTRGFLPAPPKGKDADAADEARRRRYTAADPG